MRGNVLPTIPACYRMTWNRKAIVVSYLVSIKIKRDSFGNALYKFFSDDFKNVTVSRAVPYDMSSVGDYDVIVVEIVERNIKNLLEYSEQ